MRSAGQCCSLLEQEEASRRDGVAVHNHAECLCAHVSCMPPPFPDDRPPYSQAHLGAEQQGKLQVLSVEVKEERGERAKGSRGAKAEPEKALPLPASHQEELAFSALQKAAERSRRQ